MKRRVKVNSRINKLIVIYFLNYVKLNDKKYFN